MCMDKDIFFNDRKKLKDIIRGYIILSMRENFNSGDINDVLEEFETIYDSSNDEVDELALEAYDEY